jgi:hypothetical protein
MPAKQKSAADVKTGVLVNVDMRMIADLHEGAAEVAAKLPNIWRQLTSDALDSETQPRIRMEIARYLQSAVSEPYFEMAARLAGGKNPLKITLEDVVSQLRVEMQMKLREHLLATQAPDDLVAALSAPASAPATAPETSEEPEPQSTPKADDPPHP